jgi:protein TonB
MKYLFAVMLLLLCANVFAQDTIYYDRYFMKVTDKSQAVRYETVEFKGGVDTATVRTYSISGQLQSEINYSLYSGKIQHGKTILYENGQKILEKNYKGGNLDGERLAYGSNGKPESTEVYKDGVKEKTDSTANEKIFSIVKIMPEFPGGEQAMFKFLSKNVKYPQKARRKGTSGKVYITFVIDTTGSVNYVKAIKGVSPEIDAEAVRVVKLMPKWKPGYQNGRPVSVYCNLPINFSLK